MNALLQETDADVDAGYRSRLRLPSAPSLTTLVSLLALAVVAYVPLLLTAPRSIAADTKAYLYLDPGRLMSSALSMWNPGVAGGMVTHQNIGYLLPQGPFYWLGHALSIPVWVTQRLWTGTLLFAAGSGAWYLARVIGLGARRRDSRPLPLGAAAPFVAGLVYMLSPYFLQYVQRISAIVMPWAGLGWMVAFTVLAVRRGGWRFPALFGIVVAVVGGTNATSLIYAGIAPALWVPFAVLQMHDATWRRALAATGRILLLTIAVSLWWMAGLAVEGAYGISILQFTETLPAIASTSTPYEGLRGLGYWYFYGGDRLGPWLTASVEYEEKVWLILTSFALPALALLGAAISRWRARAYFALLVLVGLGLSVGANPWVDPSLLGRAMKAFMTGTSAGLALRSTDRATPLVVLGLSMLIAGGVAAVVSYSPSRARVRLRRRHLATVAGAVSAALAVAVAVVNATPFLTGAAVEPKYSRPEQVPSYVTAAANYLDARGDSTRVLFEPGENYGVYTWGDTLDPVWPGIVSRPTIQRQQLIDGTIPTADLLEAFDLSLQQGTYEPSTLAPIARLLSAGDVVLQSNLAYWWFQTPAPAETWPLFSPPPAGVGSPTGFGPPSGDVAPAPYSTPSDAFLALPAGSKLPPALAVFPVSSVRPIYRAEPAGAPLILDGDGAGVVAAAATGILDDNPTIFYAGSLDTSARLRAETAAVPGAQLLLTDSNPKLDRRWTTVQDNLGELLPSYAIPTPSDPSAVPLLMFPGSPADAQTTAVYSGAAYVTASGYGNPINFIPENRPYEAFDGRLVSAWDDGALTSALGVWVQVGFSKPVSADQLNLVQPLDGAQRYVTQATITFDGGHPLTVDLGAASRTQAGQTVTFPQRSFKTLRITVDATNATSSLNGVGFAEIRIPGVHVKEAVQLPSDMLRSLGAGSSSHRLTVILTRDRVGAGSGRADPEPTMDRLFWLPTRRTFTLSGTARLSDLVSDRTIDSLLAGAGALGGLEATSSGRLPGDLDSRAVFAVDGNDSTAWETAPGQGIHGAWIQVRLPRPISFDHLDLAIAADELHSVPTALRITTDRGGKALVHLPAITPSPSAGRIVHLRVSFPRLTGRYVRVTIAGVGYGGAAGKPVAIAELGIPGVRVAPENPAAPLPDVCEPSLLWLDGHPVNLRIVGTVAQAEASEGLRIEGCGNSAAGIALAAGTHQLSTINGSATGIDLDRLILDSAPGGSAMPLASGGGLQPTPGTVGASALGTPAVKVLSSSATSATLSVSGASGPFWLVLGQGVDAGWRASVAGAADLGTSSLVDGYANGWYVRDPPRGTFTVNLSFAPQSEVTVALALSAVGLAACLLLALWPRRRRASHLAAPAAGAEAPALASPLAAGGSRPRLIVLLLAVLAAAAVAGAVMTPPYGLLAALVMGAVVAIGSTFSAGRILTAVPAVGLAVATGLYIAVHQAGERVPAGGGWPASFQGAAVLAWMAVLLLAADALAVSLRRRPDRPGAEASPEPDPDPEPVPEDDDG